MLKPINSLLFIFLFLFSISLGVSSVQAIPKCASPVVKTDPEKIVNNKFTPRAKFTINVGNNKAYTFKMVFSCKPDIEYDPILEGGDSLSVTLENNGSSDYCQFMAATHEVTIKAVVGSSKVEQCSATYNVLNSDNQCELSTNFTSGITSATNLTVSGQKLTPGGGFVVFFDDDAIEIPNNAVGRGLIDIPGTANVITPTFGPKSIPQELMTPGNHTISLRKRNTARDWFNPLKQERDFYDAPLCPLNLTVGTPDKPGTVSPIGTAPLTDICKKDPDKCAKAGGEPCGDDGNPGFKTAIGCIHTNPTELVKDLLRFTIGIGGGLAFLMMLLGVFQMLTSAGNPDTLNAGKDRLTNAIIGLLFIIFSILLLQLIGVDILGLPGFGR